MEFVSDKSAGFPDYRYADEKKIEGLDEKERIT